MHRSIARIRMEHAIPPAQDIGNEIVHVCALDHAVGHGAMRRARLNREGGDGHAGRVGDCLEGRSQPIWLNGIGAKRLQAGPSP